MASGLGLSIGATNLTAVVVDRAAVTRTAVLTRYPHRPPEVGLPSENPNLASERGLIINGFVDRVGDPVGIVASDGSSHRAEVLLADALRSMLYAVTRGQPPAGPVGVAHPAHWRPPAVDALRGALAAVPEFGTPAPLFSDAVAALTALQHAPGVPARGVIALCDFGGTGTSITLADAGHGFAPLAPTVRYPDLSGDLIDQALLTRVIADLSEAGSMDLSGTSAIGSLTRLRAQCRAAKERLSTAAVTSLTADLPAHRGEVRLTRNELDDAIRPPLAGFMDELQDTLQRSGIRPADLVAVASVGGGARIPIITTTLSEHLRVPIVTGAQPELAAAIGSGLKAARGTVEEGATSMAALPAVGAAAAATAAAAAVAPNPAEQATSGTPAALAWSDAQDIPDVAPAPDYGDEAAFGAGQLGDGPRPLIAFAEPDEPDRDGAAPLPWYRHPFVIVAAGIAVLLAAIAAAIVLLNRDDDPTPSTITTPTTTPSITATVPSTPAPLPPPAEPAPAQPQAPQTRTVVPRPQPPVTVTESPPPPPPPTEEPPPPPPETPPPPPPETTQPPLIPTLPYETIPGLPFVPAPFQPPPP
ncbi:Hsp70 family protein [Mycobacterium sp. URHB0044]|uniref:Hsp70 family protein n=1 Tax=Mycobacterium sp. URHB0044 TaxID=1380386 RepID=UPI00048D447C|nr:Hsp70 family protein [Mycobacterium sp. URHB0044]